jgi:hypothetical protein
MVSRIVCDRVMVLLEIVGKVHALGFDLGQLNGASGTGRFARGVVASFNFRHLFWSEFSRHTPQCAPVIIRDGSAGR